MALALRTHDLSFRMVAVHPHFPGVTLPLSVEHSLLDFLVVFQHFAIHLCTVLLSGYWTFGLSQLILISSVYLGPSVCYHLVPDGSTLYHVSKHEDMNISVSNRSIYLSTGGRGMVENHHLRSYPIGCYLPPKISHEGEREETH